MGHVVPAHGTQQPYRSSKICSSFRHHLCPSPWVKGSEVRTKVEPTSVRPPRTCRDCTSSQPPGKTCRVRPLSGAERGGEGRFETKVTDVMTGSGKNAETGTRYPVRWEIRVWTSDRRTPPLPPTVCPGGLHVTGEGLHVSSAGRRTTPDPCSCVRSQSVPATPPDVSPVATGTSVF